MDSELFLKVSQREKRTNRIEAFLVFPVAALYFSVVSWGVRADELVADAKISGSLFKKGLDIPFAVGKRDRRKICVNDKNCKYEKQRLSQEWK